MTNRLGADFFKANRQRVGRALSGGLIVATAYTALQRGNDASFGFEQEANFWYLTGIDHPDWWVIVDGTNGKTTLVQPYVNDVHELFDGSLSAEDALKISGADSVIDRADALAYLRNTARTRGLVYTPGNLQGSRDSLGFYANPAQRELKTALNRIFTDVRDCRGDIAKIRAVKTSDEITAIREAIGITAAAFEDIRSRLDGFAYEYEIEAAMTSVIRGRGAAGHAYDPIVAGGMNACTLHYTANNAKLANHGNVLIDVGARMNGYAADITRTYNFAQASKRALEVHDAVREAHGRIIELIAPGLSLRDYMAGVEDIMSGALDGLGLLTASDDYARYFPHAISHGLGLDVHDSLGAPTELKPGMILTVEPGIYIREESLGVRIEDDILVTETGFENLSAALSTNA